jgi:hypothetical protein
MKGKRIVHFLIFLCLLTSCSTKKLTNDISNILSDSPNALEAIMEKLKYSDIVFIGGVSHQLLNEKIFIHSNLQLLYDAGVRYFFVEGSITENYKYGWPEKDVSILFYPWEYVGVRYGTDNLYNEIYQLNKDKNEQDKIKLIGLETDREIFIPGTYDLTTLHNYRDEYMAQIAFEFADNAKYGEKILVLAGGLHGSIEIVPNAFGSTENWKALGVYLKEKYKDRFFSLCYVTLDENIKTNKKFYNMLNSNEWNNKPGTPKLVTGANALGLRELLPSLYLHGYNDFDGYIVDKSGIKGIMYGYALFDTEIAKEVIEQTKKLNDKISLLTDNDSLDYSNPDIYYDISYMLINVYYLKLYFGNNFPYEFWNPEMPLSEALSKLETNIFDGTGINKKIVFSLPSMDNIRSYHDYIYYFTSLNDKYWNSRFRGNIKKKIKIIEPLINKAKEYFPYELWMEYWYAKMHLKDNNYKKAYEYLQVILSKPLVHSMQFYPDILDMAIQCAEKRGFNEQANIHRNQKTSLRNEHSIDVSFSIYFLIDWELI